MHTYIQPHTYACIYIHAYIHEIEKYMKYKTFSSWFDKKKMFSRQPFLR